MKRTVARKYVDQDGRVLQKDCECPDSIHTGPHWIHMDELRRGLNRRTLEHPTYLGLLAYARQELERLREKEHQMMAHDVTAYRTLEGQEAREEEAQDDGTV